MENGKAGCAAPAALSEVKLGVQPRSFSPPKDVGQSPAAPCWKGIIIVLGEKTV